MASKSVSNNRSSSRRLVGIIRGEVRDRGSLTGFEWVAVVAAYGSPGGPGVVITKHVSVGELTGDARRKANRWIKSLAALTIELEKSEQARIEAVPRMLTRADQVAIVQEHREQVAAAA